ncbi:hypothetical protein TWF506_010721 [Arthrobotrys conoides]|uniref:Uncharacterized protein n=1 Tax=Arthrobotrys conoides TaxID=74498 RepID=A0AAN8NEE8_9PEZI
MSSSPLASILESTLSTPTQTSSDPPQNTLSPESQAEESRMGAILITVLTGLGVLTIAIALIRGCIRKCRGERVDGRNEWNPPTPPPEAYDNNWTQYRAFPGRPVTVISNGRMQRLSLGRIPREARAEMGIITSPRPVARRSGSRRSRRVRRESPERSPSPMERPRPETRSMEPPPPPPPSVTSDTSDKPPGYRYGDGPPTYEAAWDGYV